MKGLKDQLRDAQRELAEAKSELAQYRAGAAELQRVGEAFHEIGQRMALVSAGMRKSSDWMRDRLAQKKDVNVELKVNITPEDLKLLSVPHSGTADLIIDCIKNHSQGNESPGNSRTQ